VKKTHTGTVVLAAIAIAGLLAACSDDKKATTAATPAATNAPATAPAATSAADDTGTTLSPEDLVAAAQASFDKVFKGANMDPAYLENAEAHKASMDASREDPSAASVGATVKSADYLSDAQCAAAGINAPCAAVVWDLLYQDAVAIPDQAGFVVYQNGIWKVSDQTYCSVASLGTHNLDC
jgi:hypothetical protein